MFKNNVINERNPVLPPTKIIKMRRITAKMKVVSII